MQETRLPENLVRKEPPASGIIITNHQYAAKDCNDTLYGRDYDGIKDFTHGENTISYDTMNDDDVSVAINDKVPKENLSMHEKKESMTFYGDS
jgi:hypothetical protein